MFFSVTIQDFMFRGVGAASGAGVAYPSGAPELTFVVFLFV